MNIKQVAKLLNDLDIKTISTDTSLGPDVDYGVNYYKLILNKNNNKWEILYVPHERRSSGGEELRKIFDDEAEAVKYYYLIELRSYFRNKYVYSFELNNKEINIGEFNFTLENLKEAFRRLNINEQYYSFDGTVKDHSMFLERENKEESKVSFIGQKRKFITISLVLENWLIYSHMYQSVYYLYLFDQHYANLVKNNEIDDLFTDKDYKVLLTGVVIEPLK